MADTHRYTDLYAQEISGHFVGPGDSLSLTKAELADPFVKELLDKGKLVPLKGGEE